MFLYLWACRSSSVSASLVNLLMADLIDTMVFGAHFCSGSSSGARLCVSCGPLTGVLYVLRCSVWLAVVQVFARFSSN